MFSNGRRITFESKLFSMLIFHLTCTKQKKRGQYQFGKQNKTRKAPKTKAFVILLFTFVLIPLPTSVFVVLVLLFFYSLAFFLVLLFFNTSLGSIFFVHLLINVSLSFSI